MSHDHKEDPIIWEVLCIATGQRVSTLVKHTRAEAEATAKTLFGLGIVVQDTGKRKPAGKCCDTCGDVPCEKRK